MDKNNEILDRSEVIKSKLESLISEGRITEAKTILGVYESAMPNDIDIYSIKSVIFSIEGRIKEAKDTILNGLRMQPFCKDLIYNLAYIYEQEGNYQGAYETYLDCFNSENIPEVEEAVARIREIYNPINNREKIAFFIKNGFDGFIDDIISGLSSEYHVKKIIVNDLSHIDEGMRWSDICWFEWCDELVAYGSNCAIAAEKKLLCRVIGREVESSIINKVNWKNIDLVFVVNEHIKKAFLENTKGLDRGNLKIEIVGHGIKISDYPYTTRIRGYNIGYLGNIGSDKYIILALHIFNAIKNIDCKYKFIIGDTGTNQGSIKYLRYYIKEFRLEDSIIYETCLSHKEKAAWFEKIDYLIDTNIDGFLFAEVAESMCSGIKPVLHNCPGINGQYDNKFIFNTIDEAISMIMEKNYDSLQYRKYIEDNFDIEHQVKKIIHFIKNIKSNGAFNYSIYWNKRLEAKFDIESVGYIGLGQVYNRKLYLARFNYLSAIISKKMGTVKNKRIFEIGPGIGLFTDFFLTYKVKKYSSLEISEVAVSRLSQKYDKKKEFNIMLGDISDSSTYNFDEKYDLVFGADVLLHITEEKKYSSTIKHLGKILDDDGVMILCDPISVTGAKSQSPHAVIREKEYVKKELETNGLTLESFIPLYFFMNYPFDYRLLQNGKNIVDIFTLLTSFFSKEKNEETQKIVTDFLYAFDRMCLLVHNIGLTEKILIITKKKPEAIQQVVLNDCINTEMLRKEYDAAINDLRMLEGQYNVKNVIELCEQFDTMLEKLTYEKIYAVLSRLLYSLLII